MNVTCASRIYQGICHNKKDWSEDIQVTTAEKAIKAIVEFGAVLFMVSSGGSLIALEYRAEG
jgi:hypothetical protein